MAPSTQISGILRESAIRTTTVSGAKCGRTHAGSPGHQCVAPSVPPPGRISTQSAQRPGDRRGNRYLCDLLVSACSALKKAVPTNTEPTIVNRIQSVHLAVFVRMRDLRATLHAALSL